MRLLVVTHSMDRSEQALYNGLHDRGIELLVACPPDLPRGRELAVDGIRILPLRVRHRLDLGAVRILKTLLVSERIDAVYAPANRTLSVCLLARGRRATPPVVGYRGTIGHVSRLDPACWLTYLHPGVARIVCVSEAVRAHLESIGVPARRLVRIYKGHDPAWYDSLEPILPETLEIPTNAFKVAFAGNMRPVKGIPHLLQAFDRIPENIPIHLLLAGEVRDRAVTAWRHRHSDTRVHFLGYRADAPGIIGASDLFVMPSVAREGLPRAVLEAMAQRVAPVVTNVGGLPELVQDGQCGRVVNPGDPEALARAILEAYRHPSRRETWGDNARRHMESRFHIDNTLSAMQRLLSDLVAGE